MRENKMQGSFELEQAHMLAKNDNQVTYLCCMLHPFKTIRGRGFQTWQDQDLWVCTLSACFFPRVRPFYFIKMRNRFWFQLFCEAEKKFGLPDVIHLHYPAMMMIGDVLANYVGKGVRVVATEHWTKVQSGGLDKTERSELEKTLSALDTCVCVSKPLMEVMMTCKAAPKKGFCIIPNIVGSIFTPSNDTEKSCFQFAAAGRMVPNKQFSLLVEAFAEKFRGREAKLFLIGNGPEYSTLQQKIQQLGMTKKIVMTGALDRTQTAAIIAASDCLCCPSTLETFGVPVIEGWACGLPVIAFNHIPVMKEYFQPGLGISVPKDDAKAYADAMEQVFLLKDQFVKEEITKYANAYFSEKAVYRMLMELYQKSNH